MKEWLSEIEERFREALKNKDLHVWYQPQVDMRTGDPKGAEALVRWQKQDGGLILPGFFVPFLERLDPIWTGLCQPFRSERGKDGNSGAALQDYRTIWDYTEGTGV